MAISVSNIHSFKYNLIRNMSTLFDYLLIIAQTMNITVINSSKYFLNRINQFHAKFFRC